MPVAQDQDVPSSREVEDLLQPQRKLLARLRGADVVSKGDLDQAIGQVTELASAVLGVERASVWRLTEQGERLECVDLFLRTERVHRTAVALSMTTCPQYFAALHTERIIAAGDACRDPRTTALEVGYLVPNNIGAMLDVPIFLRGKMIGALCHEHVGGRRQWNLWQELIAGTLADFVAHVFEVEERARELRESAESFRTLFEAAPTPLLLARISDGTIGLLNSRAREIMRLPADVAPYEVEAARFYANAADRAAIHEDLRTHGHVDDREVPLRTFDGQPRQCLLSARPLVYRGEPHVVVGFSDVTALKEIEQRLRDVAMRDSLTGLYNRRHFYEAAALELERARRYGRPLALAMVDADKFKEKNDRYGHRVGDELLVELAKMASADLRRTDVLARIGGEEFVLLFTETELDEATRVTERLRETIAASPIATSAGPVAMTISGGVAAWSREDASLEALVDRADQALYRAKALGRNRVERASAG